MFTTVEIEMFKMMEELIHSADSDHYFHTFRPYDSKSFKTKLKLQVKTVIQTAQTHICLVQKSIL